MIKNLEINTEIKTALSRMQISKTVKLLKDELNFEISSLIINFVSEERITDINIQFLDHNYSTDIITFSYSAKQELVDAELFISPEVAAVNASRFHVTLKEELLRLIIHGILHICGFDDSEPGERRRMKRVENRLVNTCRENVLKDKI